jgi:hypothetical protein
MGRIARHEGNFVPKDEITEMEEADKSGNGEVFRGSVQLSWLIFPEAESGRGAGWIWALGARHATGSG